MLTGADTRCRMMLICSRAFSTEIMAQGSDPSAPPWAAAITRSASMIPAIGARTMGNSVLKRSRNRRSGHMVCSLDDDWDRRRRRCRRPELSTPRLAELCLDAPPDAHDRPDRLDPPEQRLRLNPFGSNPTRRSAVYVKKAVE